MAKRLFSRTLNALLLLFNNPSLYGTLVRKRLNELPDAELANWRALKKLLPYLWGYKLRIGIALLFLVLAKLANIAVPITLKGIIDALDLNNQTSQLIAVPIALLIAYGALRLSMTIFQELRNSVFAKASQRATRQIALEIFEHLHRLPLRFHLDRQTGGLSRDIERGTSSISQLLNSLLFTILPTLFEIVVVFFILFAKFDGWFVSIAMTTVVIYGLYTYFVTNWRLKYRVAMNQADSKANNAAIDSLLNYETVKYFGNEQFEHQRYDEHLQAWEKTSVKSILSLALLNVGQGLIIAIGITSLLLLAANQVADGKITLGDFVMINAFMLQLYVPLNFLGMIFGTIKRCLTDMQRMFNLLGEPQEIAGAISETHIDLAQPTLQFDKVSFAYNANRQILFDISFTVPAGQTVAVVGASGSGKSTIARLLFRFYDITQGSIKINNHDTRHIPIDTLRQAIGVVPQDTVLFNDTIEYNIRYGQPDATFEQVQHASKMAYLHSFINKLPKQYKTTVGERGLKLSGGEKQRVAIARTILKNSPILILDEATSSLDSKSEQAIQKALELVSKNRTTLVVAHRLSTVMNADNIIVLEQGHIAEQGKHKELLKKGGRYAELWRIQKEADE